VTCKLCLVANFLSRCSCVRVEVHVGRRCVNHNPLSVFQMSICELESLEEARTLLALPINFRVVRSRVGVAVETELTDSALLAKKGLETASIAFQCLAIRLEERNMSIIMS